MSTVEALLAECQRVSDAIAGHRVAIAGLTAERDGMVAELRRLGLSERAVGRLLGISGPRVHQIVSPAGDARVSAEPVSRPAKDVPPRKPAEPPAKRARAAAKTVTPAAAGVPAAAFQEPAEPAPEPRRKAECKHPGVGRKQRCRACGQFNV